MAGDTPLRIGIHVAITENGVIGRAGGLPWRLSTDLKRFRADTMGSPIVMGRKTFESVGRPLPGRLNIVVTRNKNWHADCVETALSLEEAIRVAQRRAAEMPEAREICVIGGGDIFREALPLTEILHVTHVLAAIDGDTFFPPIDPAIWAETSSAEFPAGERDSYPTRHTVYERRSAA
ncbi:MAG: dihydrofolate reductase [Hyphomicrobiales bacterium]|nr:dihydrofolate reductase [Hyphomicrobiales bacterium]